MGYEVEQDRVMKIARQEWETAWTKADEKASRLGEGKVFPDLGSPFYLFRFPCQIDGEQGVWNFNVREDLLGAIVSPEEELQHKARSMRVPAPKFFSPPRNEELRNQLRADLEKMIGDIQRKRGRQDKIGF